MKDLLLDILKDLAATAIIFIVGLTWKSTIYPFLQSVLYTGVDISGRWSVNQTGTTFLNEQLSVTRNTQVTLKQTAHRLSGKAESSVVSGGAGGMSNTYKITGKINNGLVLINFISVEKNKIAVSTFLLQVNGNGNEMDGDRLYRSSKTDKIDCIACQWTKSP